MNFIERVIEDVEHIPADVKKLFTNPAFDAGIKEAATLAISAAPYVQEIAALCPNRTVQEIALAYAKYGVPFAESEVTNPTQAGNALLNLTTTLLQKNHAPTASITILNTAVQLAVVAASATKAAPAATPAAAG